MGEPDDVKRDKSNNGFARAIAVAQVLATVAAVGATLVAVQLSASVLDAQKKSAAKRVPLRKKGTRSRLRMRFGFELSLVGLRT